MAQGMATFHYYWDGHFLGETDREFNYFCHPSYLSTSWAGADVLITGTEGSGTTKETTPPTIGRSSRSSSASWLYLRWAETLWNIFNSSLCTFHNQLSFSSARRIWHLQVNRSRRAGHPGVLGYQDQAREVNTIEICIGYMLYCSSYTCATGLGTGLAYKKSSLYRDRLKGGP